MEAEKGFSLRETVKSFFVPFENKYANIAIYALIAALSAGATYHSKQCYDRDMIRYNVGEITRQPQIHDYCPMGRLEHWVMGEKENNTSK